ncbi:hypothetical protein EYC84_012146 [Monilinia fructicola]|uniref:Uncharacterized protein n=1 Tax=Monilinia fructicola TaxID=38448 RepID=A0A5M9J6S2_MONFR|nr:hypothetical protein EYC84_012146 [Monilinia fructicola]
MLQLPPTSFRLRMEGRYNLLTAQVNNTFISWINTLHYDLNSHHYLHLCTSTFPELILRRKMEFVMIPHSIMIIQTEMIRKPFWRKDPLRMFGLFTPQALKDTKEDSIKIMHVIPKLITTEKAMEDLEIRIRRTKKYRGKAEVEAKKEFTI